MPHNIRFIVHGAVVALVYLTIISSLEDISRPAIVCGLIAITVLIERGAPKP